MTSTSIYDGYAGLVMKVMMALLLMSLALASCNNDNDYQDHVRVADQAERTLRR